MHEVPETDPATPEAQDVAPGWPLDGAAAFGVTGDMDNGYSVNTWWHRLFFVLEIALAILGVSAFVVIAFNDTSTPWWGFWIALVPAILMRILHSVVAYIAHG